MDAFVEPVFGERSLFEYIACLLPSQADLARLTLALRSGCPLAQDELAALMSRHSMQPLTGSQRQIVTDPELGCNKDCWRQNPDGSTKFDHEPTINYLYPLRRREFMAESRQRYQDAVARALALRVPGLDAVPPFLSRIVPLGCAMHHCKKVGQECHVYSIESADGPVIFTFAYEIQSTMGKNCCTHDCICDMNWTANLAVLLPGATEAATIFGVSWRTNSGDCLLRPPTALCEETARACGIDASMVGALVAVLAEMSGWGESVYDFCKEICEEYPAPERVEGQSYNPCYDKYTPRALFEGMHNAWTHYLNSLVRLQRISDFKRLNAIGKAEFHMRHPPPEPVRRERFNGDVYYDYSMPYRVSINGQDSSTNTRSYETFVDDNTDWGVTADDLVALTRSFGSSDFLDPELPSNFRSELPFDFRSTDRAEDRVQVCAKCPEDFLDKQYELNLNHFVKPYNSRYFKTYPEDCSDGTCECHPSIRHDVEELLLASDRSSLAALAVDLDGFGARLSYDDLLDGAGDSKSITRCNVRDNDEEWQRREKVREAEQEEWRKRPPTPPTPEAAARQDAYQTRTRKIMEEAGETARLLMSGLPGPPIHLKAVTQDGSEIFFKMRKTSKLSKLMEAFCESRGLRRSAVCFFYEGELLDGRDSPCRCGGQEMKDGDEIAVIVLDDAVADGEQ